MRTIGTLTTNLGGGALSLVFGLIAGGIVGTILLLLSGARFEDLWWLVYPIPVCLFAGLLYEKGRGKKIPIGMKGVLTLFSQRITFWILSEGDHWLPPGVSYEPVDMQVKTTDILDGEALSTDNVLMKGQVFYTYFVSDPDLHLSADKPDKSLVKFGVSEFRNGIASHDSDFLEEPTSRTALGLEITAKLNARCNPIGYTIVDTNIQDIQPPADISAAAARKRVEKLQSESEAEERSQVAHWIDDLGAKGISPELALETMQTERGKVVATRHTVRVEGIQGTADVVGAGLIKLAESLTKGGQS